MSALPHGYNARYIRFVEVVEIRGWSLKVYRISQRTDDRAPQLYAAARRVAEGCLPSRAVSPGRYGVGFMGVHSGRGANFVFVDWWANENELHHRPHLSTPDDPGALRPTTSTELTACVWDIALIAFERSAWIEAVLAAREPSIERYLRIRCDILL